jgi:hypothetical protein
MLPDQVLIAQTIFIFTRMELLLPTVVGKPQSLPLPGTVYIAAKILNKKVVIKGILGIALNAKVIGVHIRDSLSFVIQR